jgi:hypothetical protein
MRLRIATLSVAVGGVFAACGGLATQGLPSEPVVAGSDVALPVRPDAPFPPPPPPPVDAGTGADPRVAKLVDLDLGLVAPSKFVSFRVPANVLGVHLVVKGSGVEGVKSIRAPSGALVHSDFRPLPGDHPITISFSGSVAAAGIPMARQPETMPVAPGEWAVEIGGSARANVRVIMQTSADGQPHGGLLDVNVFLPPGLSIEDEPVDATKAERSKPLQARLDAFYTSAENLYGFGRGTVTYYASAREYDVLDDDERLLRAFSATKIATNARALNILFSNAGNQDWWGIAGGIPGAALTAGTDGSALAIAMVDGAAADVEGAVLAHEAGHFFGLSHLSEFDDNGNDPLEDTPQCPGIDAQNFPACPGADNVMAAAGSLAFTSASPLQRRVVQGSPIYRAFLVDQPRKAFPRPQTRISPQVLFGRAPGAVLTSGERLVLAHVCGVHAPKAPLSPRERASLIQVANDVHVVRGIRKRAQNLISR